MAARLSLTADLLRPFRVGQCWESATWKHARWLDGIVGTAARLAGWDVTTTSWDAGPTRDHQYFHTPDLFEAAGLPLSVEGWGRFLSLKTVPAEISEALVAPFRGTIVVGYELPELLCKVLDEAGIAVIDLVLYPVRFLDDVVFAARTNRTAIHRLLVQNMLDSREAAVRAGFVRSKASFMQPLNLKPGTAVILGQVPDDRSVLDLETGRFAHLGDHLPALIDLATSFSATLFKPHPYDPVQSATRKAMNSLRSLTWTDINLYQLLAQPEVETVCALNSSGLVEAKLFGKNTVALKPPAFSFGEAPPRRSTGFGDAVPQNAGWYSPRFWEALLAGNEDISAQTPSLPEKDRLRRALNADWGFGHIDRIVA